MKKYIGGLMAVSIVLGAGAAMANTVDYSGGPVGFSGAVYSGGAWQGVDPTIDNLTVTADVAIVGSYWLDNNNVHFNIDTLGTQETATLHGSFTTNQGNQFYLYMAGVPAGCDMSKMKSGVNTMDVAWSGTPGLGIGLNADKSAVVSSPLAYGTTNFEINCTLAIGANQPAGHYELDPTIEIKSIL